MTILDDKLFNKLLNKIKEDDDALNALYDYFYPRIVLHIKRTYPCADADDIAQEFFLRLLTFPCRTYVLNPASWVYKACENLAKEKYAEVAEEYPASDLLDGVSAPVFVDEIAAVSIQARELFEKITDQKTRNIVYLYHWEGYNFREIGKILGMNCAAVRQRYSRVIKVLKKIENSVSQIDPKSAPNNWRTKE